MARRRSSAADGACADPLRRPRAGLYLGAERTERRMFPSLGLLGPKAGSPSFEGTYLGHSGAACARWAHVPRGGWQLRARAGAADSEARPQRRQRALSVAALARLPATWPRADAPAGASASAGAQMPARVARRGAARAAAALCCAALASRAAGDGWGRFALASGAASMRVTSDATGTQLCMWLADGSAVTSQPCLATGLPAPAFAGTCAQLAQLSAAPTPPPVRASGCKVLQRAARQR